MIIENYMVLAAERVIQIHWHQFLIPPIASRESMNFILWKDLMAMCIPISENTNETIFIGKN